MSQNTKVSTVQVESNINGYLVQATLYVAGTWVGITKLHNNEANCIDELKDRFPSDMVEFRIVRI